MASTILSRTISSVVDKRIVLSNSQFSRPHGITTWTTLRIGLRMIMNNIGASLTGTPRFYVGLGSGTTNMIMDATTDNWCGIVSNATWTYAAGPPVRYSVNPVHGGKKVGTTLTLTASAVDPSDSVIFMADATTTNRFLYFVEITKGSPNYTLNLQSFRINPTTAGDATAADFLAQVVQSAPLFTNHQNGTARTLAVDESTGTFDHVCIGWDQVSPTIEICDLAVVKLA